MPNLKIHVDDRHWPALRGPLEQALPRVQALLCREFQVDPPACQLAVIPVLAMADLPALNAELHILPRPERTRARVAAAAGALQRLLAAETGLPTAVRIASLDPETYVALKG